MIGGVAHEELKSAQPQVPLSPTRMEESPRTADLLHQRLREFLRNDLGRELLERRSPVPRAPK
jgi:hypothetical protein